MLIESVGSNQEFKQAQLGDLSLLHHIWASARKTQMPRRENHLQAGSWAKMYYNVGQIAYIVLSMWLCFLSIVVSR